MDKAIKPGTVGFAQKRGFASWVIRWFTRSEWSHTFIVVGDLYGTNLVLEAGKREVLITRFDKYMDSKYKYMLFEPSETIISKTLIVLGLREVSKRLEVQYGYWQIVGIVLCRIWGRLTRRTVSNVARGGEICSELVLRFLRIVDADGSWWALDRNLVTPEDLYELIIKTPKFTPVV